MNRPPQRPGAHHPAFVLVAVTLLALLAALAAAQAPELPKGIGPYAEVELAQELDADLAAQGEALFGSLCSACHKFGERYVGPDLAGVSERRSPEWLLNLLLNTDQMLFQDDTAYELLAEYMTPMPQLVYQEEQALALLEFFRLHDAQ